MTQPKPKFPLRPKITKGRQRKLKPLSILNKMTSPRTLAALIPQHSHSLTRFDPISVLDNMCIFDIINRKRRL